MKGKRIFERLGFNLPEQPQQAASTKVVVDFENWTFPFTYSSAISSEIASSEREFLQFSVEQNMKKIGRVLNSVKQAFASIFHDHLDSYISLIQ